MTNLTKQASATLWPVLNMMGPNSVPMSLFASSCCRFYIWDRIGYACACAYDELIGVWWSGVCACDICE